MIKGFGMSHNSRLNTPWALIALVQLTQDFIAMFWTPVQTSDPFIPSNLLRDQQCPGRSLRTERQGFSSALSGLPHRQTCFYSLVYEAAHHPVCYSVCLYEHKHIKTWALNFLLVTPFTSSYYSCMRKASTLTGRIVLVVMDELRNGAEQVLFCQVECSLPCFCLSDLIMNHPGSPLPSRPAENKEKFLCKERKVLSKMISSLCNNTPDELRHYVFLPAYNDLKQSECHRIRTNPARYRE